MLEPNLTAEERQHLNKAIEMDQPPSDFDEDDPQYFKDIIRDRSDSNATQEAALNRKLEK